MLVPFELRPDAPAEGVSAREHGLTHSARVEERLLQLAEEAGQPMVLPDLVPNTHAAMVLAEFARDLGPDVHRAAHLGIFRAYYGRGEDIGSREVLLGVARETGLAADEVVAAWGDGRYDGRLHEFYHLALHLGIDSTPAALICNELLIGSRPYGVIRDAVQRCLVTPAAIEAEADPDGAGPGADPDGPQDRQ